MLRLRVGSLRLEAGSVSLACGKMDLGGHMDTGGALMIRIGFWGPLQYTIVITRNPQKKTLFKLFRPLHYHQGIRLWRASESERRRLAPAKEHKKCHDGKGFRLYGAYEVRWALGLLVAGLEYASHVLGLNVSETTSRLKPKHGS